MTSRSYSNLPNDITFDILFRLPAKSIGRCRCVSKPWRTLLYETYFIKTHLQLTKFNSLESLAIIDRSGPRLGSFIYSAALNDAHDKITPSVTKLSFVGNHPDPMYKIYGSCDGLLLVYDDRFMEMFVMNPLTREMMQVSHYSRFLMNSSEAYFTFGFGYDSVTDDYKIVMISYSCTWKKSHPKFVTRKWGKMFVSVYSFKTGWKKLERPSYDFAISHKTPGAFAGGCLHWFARTLTKNKEVVIVAFNLVDEKFLEIPHPHSDLLSYNIYNFDSIFSFFWPTLAVVAGCLCLYINRYIIREVWVMKEYGIHESWTSFALNYNYHLLNRFLNNQEQVVLKVRSTNPYVMWNLKRRTFKEIMLDGSNDNPNNIFLTSVETCFVESLVSPHARNKSNKARMSFSMNWENM